MAEPRSEGARAKTRCQGVPASVSRDSGPFEKTACPLGPRVKPGHRAQPPAWPLQSGGGTFTVHFREQLAQGCAASPPRYC